MNGTVWHEFSKDAARRSFDAFSSDKQVLRERAGLGMVTGRSGTDVPDADSPWEPDRSASLLWNGLASIQHGLVDPSWPYPPFPRGAVGENIMSAAVRGFQRGLWLN